jgi:ParB-like chromosome segregation protein Spo0J
MPNLHIEYIAISDLKPNPRNARVHSQKHLHQIAASISEFGFNVPVLIDRGNIIIAGHGRVDAARKLGMETVPVLRIEHLTDEQKRAFALADNKIALNSDWDLEMLQLNLKELSALDLNFDLEITGFETAQTDVLIDGPTQQTKADLSDIVPEKEAEAVSRLGDLWLLGDHKLVCADACDKASYAELMDGETARVVFTDPPIMFRSTVTSAAWARSSTGNSRWRRVK